MIEMILNRSNGRGACQVGGRALCSVVSAQEPYAARSVTFGADSTSNVIAD